MGTVLISLFSLPNKAVVELDLPIKNDSSKTNAQGRLQLAVALHCLNLDHWDVCCADPLAQLQAFKTFFPKSRTPPCEVVEMHFPQVKVCSNGQCLQMQLVMTDFRLVFLAGNSSYAHFVLPDLDSGDSSFSFSIGLLKSATADSEPMSIQLATWDMRLYRVVFPPQCTDQLLGSLMMRLDDHICNRADLVGPRRLFSATTTTTSTNNSTTTTTDTKDSFQYDISTEMRRQGLHLDLPADVAELYNMPWRFSSVNSNYSLCASYPPLLVVPGCVPDAAIVAAAHHRSKGRIPAVTYYHRARGTVLARCSQPRVGLTGMFAQDQESDVLIVQVQPI
jgi:hypothetical protein